jgi:hypothetical protein
LAKIRTRYQYRYRYRYRLSKSSTAAESPGRCYNNKLFSFKYFTIFDNKLECLTLVNICSLVQNWVGRAFLNPSQWSLLSSGHSLSRKYLSRTQTLQLTIEKWRLDIKKFNSIGLSKKLIWKKQKILIKKLDIQI